MNCIETKKNIELLLDGELDAEKKMAVELHLQACPACCEAKEDAVLLSQFLRESSIEPPTPALDARVKAAFRRRRSPRRPGWRQLVCGAFAIPKPAFAALLLAATATAWAAFQIGKISSTTISIDSPVSPANEKPAQAPPEIKVQTLFVEVPVIKEKIVTCTIRARESKNERNKSQIAARRENDLPRSSSVADNNYFTDVSLKGFQPAAEMGAKIIKGEKENEK